MPEVGKTYTVTHSRKGKFCLKVTAINGDWVSGQITDGTAGARLPENERYEGEAITVRASFCSYVEHTPS